MTENQNENLTTIKIQKLLNFRSMYKGLGHRVKKFWPSFTKFYHSLREVDMDPTVTESMTS